MKKYKQYFIIFAFVIMGCKNEFVEEKEPFQDVRNFCSYTVNGFEKRLYNKDSISISASKYLTNGGLGGRSSQCPITRVFGLSFTTQNFRNIKGKIDYDESISLDEFSPDLILKQINMEGKCSNVNTFKLSLLHFEYPDVFYKPFEVDSLSINSMKIIKIDTVSKHIEGEFNLTFNKTKEAQKDKYFNFFPNRYEFRNGRFSVYYK